MIKGFKGFVLLVAVVTIFGCGSEQKSVEIKNEPVLYADARLDIKEDAKNLALFIGNILETLPQLSKKKTVPEKEKLEHSLNLIRGFLLKEHGDIDSTIRSIDYLEGYINKYHPDFLTKEKLNHIKSTIIMMSRWPTYS